ncbi:MAG: LysR family transcriptional regulator [Alphaproteobacteria bacterium]|nr:LysR family transcriptional regulator [Alphaproteobacteria bacterium]
MIDWDLWHTLLAVFRHGTYLSASRALQVDPTTIGRKIKALERQLGYKLFVRENDRLYPTSQCEDLLPNIEAAAEALRGIDDEAAKGDQGTIWRDVRITAPPFLVLHLLAPHLGDLIQNLRVNAELIGTADKRLLSRREVDIALRIEDDPNEDMATTSLVRATRVGEIHYGIYYANDIDPETVPWAGIVERTRRTTGADAQNKVAGADGIRYRVNRFEELCQLAVGGSAKAMLPKLVAGRDERLTSDGETVLRQSLWMFYHRQDEDTGYLVAMRERIAKLVQEMLKG